MNRAKIKAWYFRAVGLEFSYTHYYDADSDERGTVVLDLKLLSDVRSWAKHGNKDQLRIKTIGVNLGQETNFPHR